MVQIKKQLVSESVIKKVTYGYGNPVNYITIHQTGNTNNGADAQAHANLQSNGNSRNASWHYQVDDKQAIQSFPDDVKCWHASDGKGPGNTQSIAIEICVNSDGDYKKAVENAAELTKYLLDKHNLSIDKVKQHYDWYPKNCPAQLRAGYKGITWNDFLNMIEGKKVQPAPKQKVKSKVIKSNSKSISQMADEVIAGKHGTGHEARRKSLGISKSEYEKVRAEVNRRLGVSTPKPKHKPKKSISQMATEVIQGKHGIGHENRRKSLGIDKATYEKVRAEVNRRLK